MGAPTSARERCARLSKDDHPRPARAGRAERSAAISRGSPHTQSVAMGIPTSARVLHVWPYAWLATRVRNFIRCNHHRMDRKSSVQPIRLNPYIKESNESLRDSSVTVVCWHIDVTNLQLYILNHGPARPGPPRVSAFHPVQPRPFRRPPPNSIQSSRVTRPGRLSQSGNVQTPAIRVRASAAPPSARVQYSRSTAGTLDVHCMCIWIVSNPRA